MMRKKMAMVIASIILAGSISACGGTSNISTGPESVKSQTSDAEYTLRIGTQWVGTNPHTRTFTESFVPRVEELSGGRIKCEVFENCLLGNESDMLGQMQLGQLEMQAMSELSANLDPGHINILTLPYLFTSTDHYFKVCDGELGEKIYGGMIDQGIRVLGTMDYGYRYMTNNVRPINSVEDVKGLKMRVSTNEYQLALWDALGANTVVVPFSELYTALETGAVDGQENPYGTIASQRFYECQKYVANTAHVHGVLYMGISEEWYSALPEDLQEAVSQAATEACEFNRKIVAEQEKEDIQACIDGGMTITDPDLRGFREAAQPVYDKFYSQYPDSKELVEKIIALGEE